MPQIQAPVTFSNGQTVDATDFNNHVNGAIVLPGIITDFANITANTVAANDSLLLYDLSDTLLKEANVSDILNSNLGITTSSITGGPGANLSVTPATGYLFSVSTGGTFGGNLSVTGTITSTGEAVIGGNLTVSGTTAAFPAVTATTVAASGNATVGGNLVVTGSITQSGGLATKLLYDIQTFAISNAVATSGTLSSFTTGATFYTTTQLTKPAGEIWVFVFNGTCVMGRTNGAEGGTGPGATNLIRLSNGTTGVDYYKAIFSLPAWEASNSTNVTFAYLSPTSETFDAPIAIKASSNATNAVASAQDASLLKLGATSAAVKQGGSFTSYATTPGSLTIYKYKA